MAAPSASGPAPAATATLPRLFAGWVRQYGAEPALSRRVDGVFIPFTYDELDRRASVLALALARELGVRRGEFVALVCDNRSEWMVCSLAIHFLGAVDVPRASDTPPEILEAILRHAEPAVVILEDPAQLPLVCEALPGLRAAVVIDGSGAGVTPSSAACRVDTLAGLMALGEAAWPAEGAEVLRRRDEVQPDDLATVIYTSGTTGAPTGVALTHANYELNLRELPELLHIEREPVISVLQPWHAHERQMQLMYLSKGCCIHYSHVLTLRGDLKAVRPVVMATVPELWVKLYKGVFLKIDGRPPFQRKLTRWLIGRSLVSARARRLLEGREPEVRPHGPVLRAAVRAWARVAATTLRPFLALADHLVFREVRAGSAGTCAFPASAAARCPTRWTSSSTPPARPCSRATA